MSSLFDEITPLPADRVQRRYDQLVGLDHVKDTLVKEAYLLLNPALLEQWSVRHYARRIAAAEAFTDRTPLFVFAGDPGTGKTALAETFGDAAARAGQIAVVLMKLSLRTRGDGKPGQVTDLLGRAFEHVAWEVPTPQGAERVRRAGVLLIDEADALAQSRDSDDMAHEDRAGVNALLRALDTIIADRRPVLTVLCTNRLGAIDSSITRRAAHIVHFARPNATQRAFFLQRGLGDTGLEAAQLTELVVATGPTSQRPYGYTYSDLQRLITGSVLAAFPDAPITYESVRDLAQLPPTRPMLDSGLLDGASISTTDQPD